MDQAHEYRLLTYHVSRNYQVNQLAALGFDGIEVFRANGTQLAVGEARRTLGFTTWPGSRKGRSQRRRFPTVATGRSMARQEARTMSLAFVACIESGPLEDQTILLCRSIRRFAGRFRDAPIYTFQPRAGTAIARETLDVLNQWG